MLKDIVINFFINLLCTWLNQVKEFQVKHSIQEGKVWLLSWAPESGHRDIM